MQDSEVLHPHEPCPDCGSSDGMSIYDDGHTFCFVCKKWRAGEGEAPSPRDPKKPLPLLEKEDIKVAPLRKRGITSTTCERYGYSIGVFKGQTVQVAPYYNDIQELVGQKIRTKDKDFITLGKVSDRFFGQHLFQGGKKLVITEGEIDCLSVSQAFDNKYPVVSLPLGSQSAKKVFKAQLDWLERFEEVVLMFDMDAPGQQAVEEVLGYLTPGKTKVAKLPRKDANECLINEESHIIKSSVWNAQSPKPDSIVNANELWEEVNTDNTMGFNLPWDVPINEMLMGLRKGEITLLTAGTGVGKSTLFRELQYHFGHTLNLKVGMMMLEEAPRKTIKGLMSIHTGHRLHLNRAAISDEEYRRAFDELTETGNFIVYKHFGSLGEDSLMTTVRYLAVVEKVDFIFLDHISIAVSGIADSDERKLIDRLMTNLRSLVEETGVGLCVISHLTRKSGSDQSHEEGGRVSLNQLRGSGSLGQLPDTIIAVERNQQDEGEAKNLMLLRSLKCRETGETGAGGYLHYDKTTGRLNAADPKDFREEPESFSIEEPEF